MKYFAFAGIRDVQNPTDDLKEFPFIVIMGPSGQMAQVHGPSGVVGKIPEDTHDLHAWEQTFCHRPLSFYNNRILLSLRNGANILNRNFLWAWEPFGQIEDAKINSAGFVSEPSADADDLIIKDGYNWTLLQAEMADFYRQHYAFLDYGGSAFWVFPYERASLSYGTYKGEEPHFEQQGAESGWKFSSGKYGPANRTADPNYNIQMDGGFTNPRWGGIKADITVLGNLIDNICDMVEHKGIIYIAKQYGVYSLIPGGRGVVIHMDYQTDEDIDDITESSDYTSRKQQNIYGTGSRSFAVHNDTLYMLQNNGKLFEITPGGIRQKADLTTIGTPWSSGIIGGAISLAITDNTWPGAVRKRCYLASFNNQLHAFLNFSSNYKLSEGTTGQGVFWGTSFDAENWSDRSENLPASGIHPPSGLNNATWRSTINPYLFSGRNLTVWPNGYDAPSGIPCQPSGFRQTGLLPWWGSGILRDPANTSYDSLKVPLNKGALSGYLFPTFVQYPEGYGFQNGSFGPSGVGPSGYDYTGCHNYHISGNVDKDENVLHLMFTEDFDDGGTLLYDLTKSSGWIQKNWATETKQLNGYIPIDLYSPEIIMASGDLYNPNPRVDEVNQRVYIDYDIYDWGYWDSSRVFVEYSTNGQDWATADHIAISGKSDPIVNRTTGTKETDPSGVNGAPYTICWEYSKDISKNVFYPNVMIRLRAESV